MTPIEVAKAVLALAKSIGPEAYVSGSIAEWDLETPAHLSIYPNGICKERSCRVRAPTWEEAFVSLNATWAECSARYRVDKIRTMALSIIKITADRGACSDFALRADKFSQSEIDLYSEEAIADANLIASNGPFSILRSEKANAA